MPDEPQEAQLAISLPSGVHAEFANKLMVWHTGDEFTLDFLCTDMPRRSEGGTVQIPAPIVARIKVPVSVIFRVAQAIATNVDIYEKTHGAITPQPHEVPLFPPDEGGTGGHHDDPDE